MSDEAEIIALVHAYGFLLDAGDIDGVVALFEHATWRSDAGDAVRRGGAEVRPVYEALLSSLEGTRTKHLLTNLTVVVGPDAQSATSRCHWTVLEADGSGQIRITLSGQYHDRFERSDGAWRFADRFIMTDLVRG